MGGSCISGSVSRSAGWGGADRIQSPSEQPCPVLNASSARPCASTLYLHHIVPSQAHKAGPAFARFWRRGNRGSESSRALARAALLASGRVGLGCRPLEATAFRPPPGWGFGTFGAGGPLPARDCAAATVRVPARGRGQRGAWKLASSRPWATAFGAQSSAGRLWVGRSAGRRAWGLYIAPRLSFYGQQMLGTILRGMESKQAPNG